MAKRVVVILLVLVLALAAVPMTFAQGDMAIESVCLVTDIGRINDGTFNQYAYDGMAQAASDFELDSTFIETTSETDYANNIDTCVQEGYDVIVTVGFLIADATRAAAEANPDTYFIGVDQFVVDGPSNYVGIQFREDQAGFLVGAMAALVTESNIVAGVYGIDIPPVVKFRNGFEQGVAFINAIEGKEVEALGVYIDSFIAPDRGASAAAQFIGDGADVIFGAGGPTGSGGITEAAQQGVWVIGVDQDEYFTTFGAGETPGADKIISSAQKAVNVGVYNMIGALTGDLDIEFVGGGNYILDVANGGITFAPKHDADIPDEVYEKVEEIRVALAEGIIETGVDPATGAIVTPVADMMIDFEFGMMGGATIAEIAAGDTNFQTLLTAVGLADPSIAALLADPNAEITVFAPTNEAFTTTLQELGLAVTDVASRPDLVTEILKYHVVVGKVMAADVMGMDGAEVETAQGESITISVDGDTVMINGSATVTAVDIVASNGVIHVIDRVLVPQMVLEALAPAQ